MANLRSADTLLATAIAETIDALDLTAADAAAIRLARHYAQAVDAQTCGECGEHRTLDVLGPKLLAVLESLGATPAARSRLKGGAPSAGTTRLAALREARRA